MRILALAQRFAAPIRLLISANSNLSKRMDFLEDLCCSVLSNECGLGCLLHMYTYASASIYIYICAKSCPREVTS